MKEAAVGGGGGAGAAGFVRADQIDLKSLDEQLDRHLARAWTMDKPKHGDVGNQERRREDWEADPARLVVRGVIARGTFGTVHRGVYDGLDVAVKLLDWGEDGHRSEQEITAIRAAFSQEVSVWHKLDHPNVTKVLFDLTCYCVSVNLIWLIFFAC